MVVATTPPTSVIGRTLESLTWQERYDVSLLAIWQPSQEGPPQPPKTDRPIAKTDILILLGHIDRLRELRKMK
jgi:Trk K+ transport system NAD-binding subunit